MTAAPACLGFLTFSIDEPLPRGRVGGGQLLFDLGDVLGVKVVEQALAYQVVLDTEGEKDEEVSNTADDFKQ